jgi:hypothetical protein
MKHSLKYLKQKCVACERSGVDMNKEHVFPQWLILRTNNHNTSIRWMKNRRVPALRATLPLCRECNSAFGHELERPVSRLFDEIESQEGISDTDAEFLIRWLWKTQGFLWCAANPEHKYTENYTLRERVLRPIDSIREHLVLAVALIDRLHPESTDWPMGIDSNTLHDAVFVAGVFSKIALMVLIDSFVLLVPRRFSIYNLAPKRDAATSAKLFFPKTGFSDDVEAVGVTFLASQPIAEAHDDFWTEIRRKDNTRYPFI